MNEKDYICTYSGKKFYPLDPKAEDIYIEDIAHALSLTCRFNGHCRYFYSVAQHSCVVSELCSNENKMAGFLHDGAEAFINDLSTPIKKNFPYYKTVEDKIMEVIAKKWDFTWPISKEVKSADLLALAIEKEALMNTTEQWEGVPKDPNPEEHHFVCYPSDEVEETFLHNFNELINKHYDNLWNTLHKI